MMLLPFKQALNPYPDPIPVLVFERESAILKILEREVWGESKITPPDFARSLKKEILTPLLTLNQLHFKNGEQTKEIDVLKS